MLPAIFGLSGPTLTDDEHAFFREAEPAGYILFARNCLDTAQVRALTADLRELSGRAQLPILIDQEGGRVARLGPPEWPIFPPAQAFDRLYQVAPISSIEAARANAQALAAILADLGINVDCIPLLDVRQAGAHHIIGDRALGSEPMQVAALGRAVLEGLAAGGVVGVVKHIPGHGRACSDSHFELPVVSAGRDELEADLAPFRALHWAPMGMTAHVLYTALDPQSCASLSPIVVQDTIRREIGFEGLLMSDDLGMRALEGPLGERAKAAIAAGCDLVLHCSGRIEEMEQVVSGVSEIADLARDRLERAMSGIARAGGGASYEKLAEKRDKLLSRA